jgi:hypothetical protein
MKSAGESRRAFVFRPALGGPQSVVPRPHLRPPTLSEFEAGLGRRRSYSGLLGQPRGIQIYPLLETVQQAGAPPWYQGTLSDWRTDIERIRARELDEWMRRAIELAKHYGIELKAGLDMQDEWHRLAIALAAAHVPAFECGRLGSSGWDWRRARFSANLETRAQGVTTRPVSLTPRGVNIFAMAVSDALLQGFKGPRQIAKFVLKHVPKGKLMVPAPKRGDAVGMRDLSFETARILVPLLRTAWRDVCEGGANTFQHQAVANAIEPVSFVKHIGIRWKPIFALDGEHGTEHATHH